MTVEPTNQQTETWAGDFIAKSQICPACFGSPAKHATRENRGIMLADYVCGSGHLWSVRWSLAQVIA